MPGRCPKGGGAASPRRPRVPTRRPTLHRCDLSAFARCLDAHRHLFVVFLVLGLAGCVTGQPSGAARPLTATARARCDALRRAYNAPEPANRLDAFFQAWHQRGLRPASETNPAALDDTLRIAYDLFEAFFDLPTHRRGLGRTDHADEVARPTRYLVLPDAFDLRISLHTALLDTTGDVLGLYDGVELRRLAPFSHERTVSHFRPPLPASFRGRDLYLTRDDEEAFNCFIGSGVAQPAGLMTTAVPARSTRRRAEALRPFVTVVPGHWGGYWHVLTQPYAASIVFAKDLQPAVVGVQSVYSFGYAYYERRSGRWVLRREKLTGGE